MRTLALLVIVTLLLLGAAAALHAEDEDSDRVRREHARLMDETVAIQILELRARAQERLNQSLFELLEAHVRTLKAGGNGSVAVVNVLNLRITELEESLETERKRSGVDENELMQQLVAEQKRHTRDVQLLQTELVKANEIAECNRLEATQSWQRVTVHEEEGRRLRKRLVQAVWLLGEIGPAAKIALPWLKETVALDDEILVDAAKTATARIQGDGK